MSSKRTTPCLLTLVAIVSVASSCATTAVGREIDRQATATLAADEGLAAMVIESSQPVTRLVITHRATRHQFEQGPLDAGSTRRLVALPSGTWCTELVMLGQAELHIIQPPCFDVAPGATTYVGVFHLEPGGFALKPVSDEERRHFEATFETLGPAPPTPAEEGAAAENSIEVYDPDE